MSNESSDIRRNVEAMPFAQTTEEMEEIDADWDPGVVAGWCDNCETTKDAISEECLCSLEADMQEEKSSVVWRNRLPDSVVTTLFGEKEGKEEK